MISDNSSQLVDAERELREMIQGWNHKELKEFSVEEGMRWQFITLEHRIKTAAQRL